MNSTCFFPSATLYNMKKYIEECGVGSDLSISVLEKEKKTSGANSFWKVDPNEF